MAKNMPATKDITSIKSVMPIRNNIKGTPQVISAAIFLSIFKSNQNTFFNVSPIVMKEVNVVKSPKITTRRRTLSPNGERQSIADSVVAPPHSPRTRNIKREYIRKQMSMEKAITFFNDFFSFPKTSSTSGIMEIPQKEKSTGPYGRKNIAKLFSKSKLATSIKLKVFKKTIRITTKKETTAQSSILEIMLMPAKIKTAPKRKNIRVPQKGSGPKREIKFPPRIIYARITPSIPKIAETKESLFAFFPRYSPTKLGMRLKSGDFNDISATKLCINRQIIPKNTK